MATNIETMWVTDQDNLQRTVQTLVAQGGVVQGQADTEVTVFLKKKMNIVVLIVGLVLCIVPGLAYLIWYATADQSQQITVKVGSPTNIKTDHQHWYDGQDAAGSPTVPTGAPAVPAAPASPELPTTDVPPPGYALGAPSAPVVPAPLPPEASPLGPNPAPPAPPAPPGSPII